jgi:hypothetical protein
MASRGPGSHEYPQASPEIASHLYEGTARYLPQPPHYLFSAVKTTTSAENELLRLRDETLLD